MRNNYPIRKTKHGKPCRACGGTLRFVNYPPACVKCYGGQRYNPETGEVRKLVFKGRHWGGVHGLAPGVAEARMASNGYKCVICSDSLTRETAVIDHCHDRLKVRDVICRKCNVMLGMANDKPEVLERAAAYLRWHTLQ